ncbi:hypothetical protein ACEWY4_025706 [Coilia grayii]|uniref:PH domain-containing protein n=1 Tax=Coilia grayii TaxID=363190 RepID=A0ABD1IVQ4_9TELE
MSHVQKQKSTELDGVEKVHSGYLRKSPFSGNQGAMKSWKRRFFELLKTSEDVFHLKYYESEERRDKALGTIDMSQVLLVLFCPENHTKWASIHKNFGCTPSCVLILKTVDRDFFLIGENSTEMDIWYKSLTLKQQGTQKNSAGCEKNDKNKDTDGYIEMAALEIPLPAPGGSLLASFSQALQELDEEEESEPQSEDKDSKPDDQSELLSPVEIEVCVSKDNLQRHLSLTEEEIQPRPMVASWTETSTTLLTGDKILAINDIRVDSTQEIEKYLTKVQKDEVKVTVRRLSKDMEDS